MSTLKYSLTFNYPMYSDEQLAAAGEGMVPVPSELLSDIVKLPDPELAICRFLLSKTYSKHQDWVELSILDLAEGSAIPVTQVKPTLEKLSGKGVVVVNPLP